MSVLASQTTTAIFRLICRGCDVTQCVVSVCNTDHYLLPKKQALLLMDLLSQAAKVERRWLDLAKGETGKYKIKEPPHVQIETVTDKDLVYNEETTQKGATK